ncbi:MAG: fumarylacetoacetate hydrolase family protein [bacterium]
MIRQFVRFAAGDFEGYGFLEEEGKIRAIEGDIYSDTYGDILSDAHITDLRYDPERDQVRILPPCRPSKIVAVGLNYRDHARELHLPEPQEPLIFLKPPSAVIGHEEAIMYPWMSRQVEYEGELGIIMGRKAKGIAAEETAGYILGYTCVNDITARDLQKKDGQWTRAKSFDTFAAIGPCLAVRLAAESLIIRSRLNGQLRQSSNTNQLIFSPAFLVSFISQIMTLFPGDVISTGTPAGVGPLQPGDVVEVEIEGIGTLRNRVVAGQPEG